MLFEWNADKDEANIDKHGVPFEEAATAFGDPFSLTIADPWHSMDESRFVLLGETLWGRLVVVAHVARGNRIRLISARMATRRERRTYEEEG